MTSLKQGQGGFTVERTRGGEMGFGGGDDDDDFGPQGGGDMEDLDDIMYSGVDEVRPCRTGQGFVLGRKRVTVSPTLIKTHARIVSGGPRPLLSHPPRIGSGGPRPLL